MQECPHYVAYKGTHESFEKLWLCPDCGKLVEIDLKEYAVVLAAFRFGKAEKDERARESLSRSRSGDRVGEGR